jgi:hypothetical protein
MNVLAMGFESGNKHFGISRRWRRWMEEELHLFLHF